MKNILPVLVLILFITASAYAAPLSVPFGVPEDQAASDYSDLRLLRSPRYRLDEPTGAAPVMLNLFLKEAMCLQGDI